MGILFLFLYITQVFEKEKEKNKKNIMPKNKGLGGGGFRKGSRATKTDSGAAASSITKGGTRTLLLAENESQYYACVEKMMGNGWCMLHQLLPELDKVGNPKFISVMGKIRGSMYKKVWINRGDLVLITTRDFDALSNKVDIIHKYTDAEVKQLKKLGELPASLNLSDPTHLHQLQNTDTESSSVHAFTKTTDISTELVFELDDDPLLDQGTMSKLSNGPRNQKNAERHSKTSVSMYGYHHDGDSGDSSRIIDDVYIDNI